MAGRPVTAVEVRAEVGQAQRDISKLVTAYHKQQGAIQKLSDSTSRLGRSFGSAGRSMATFRNALGLLGLGTLGYQMRAAVTRALEFDRAMVNVQKTTDITGTELAKLGDSLKDLGEYLGTSATELARITGLAGQLGIRGSAALLKFTEVIAKLQRATNLTGEEAATQLARVLQLTGADVLRDIEKLGSVIVRLGNSLATTERDLVAMAEKIAPTMRVFDASATDVLGFSGALTSVGVEGSSAATAMLRLFGALDKAADSVRVNSREMKVFADVLGMTNKEAQEFIKNDIQLAGARFLSNLGGVQNRTEVLAAIGIPALREQKVHLGAASPLTERSLLMARAEANDPTELERENRAQLDSLTGQIDQAMTTVGNILLDFGNVIAREVLPMLNGLKWFIDAFKSPTDAKTFKDALAFKGNTTEMGMSMSKLLPFYDQMNDFERKNLQRAVNYYNMVGDITKPLHEQDVDYWELQGHYDEKQQEKFFPHTNPSDFQDYLNKTYRRLRMQRHDVQKGMINQFHTQVSGGGSGGFNGGFAGKRIIDVPTPIDSAEGIKRVQELEKMFSEFYEQLSDDTRGPSWRRNRALELRLFSRDQGETRRLAEIAKQAEFQMSLPFSMQNYMNQSRHLGDPSSQFRFLMDRFDPNLSGREQMDYLKDAKLLAASIEDLAEVNEKLAQAAEQNRQDSANMVVNNGQVVDGRSLFGQQIREGRQLQAEEEEYKVAQATRDRIKAMQAIEINNIDKELQFLNDFHKQKMRHYEDEKRAWLSLAGAWTSALQHIMGGGKLDRGFFKGMSRHAAGLLFDRKIARPLMQGLSDAYDRDMGKPELDQERIDELKARKYNIKKGKFRSIDEAVEAIGYDAFHIAVNDIGEENILQTAEEVGDVKGGVLAKLGDKLYYETLDEKKGGKGLGIELANIKEVDKIEGKEIKIEANVVNVSGEAEIVKSNNLDSKKNRELTGRSLDIAADKLKDMDFGVDYVKKRLGREVTNQFSHVGSGFGNEDPKFGDFVAKSLLNTATGGLSSLLGIEGLATGGNIREAGLAMVGENGPEVVSLPKGAKVTPLDPMDKIGNRNSTPNITINVNGVQDPVVFENVIDEQLPRISEAVKGDIMSNVGNNSDFSATTGI